MSTFLAFDMMDQECIGHTTQMLNRLYDKAEVTAKQFQAVVLTFCKLATEPTDPMLHTQNECLQRKSHMLDMLLHLIQNSETFFRYDYSHSKGHRHLYIVSIHDHRRECLQVDINKFINHAPTCGAIALGMLHRGNLQSIIFPACFEDVYPIVQELCERAEG